MSYICQWEGEHVWHPIAKLRFYLYPYLVRYHLAHSHSPSCHLTPPPPRQLPSYSPNCRLTPLSKLRTCPPSATIFLVLQASILPPPLANRSFHPLAGRPDLVPPCCVCGIGATLSEDKGLERQPLVDPPPLPFQQVDESLG